eukprot:g46254.t1
MNLLRRQTWDASNRVPFVVQYLLGAEKQHHVLRSLQHIVDDNERLTNIFPTPPLLTFEQPPNLKQTIIRSKLPSLQDSIDHNTVMATSARLVRSSTWTPPLHVGTSPTTYTADTH